MRQFLRFAAVGMTNTAVTLGVYSEVFDTEIATAQPDQRPRREDRTRVDRGGC